MPTKADPRLFAFVGSLWGIVWMGSLDEVLKKMKVVSDWGVWGSGVLLLFMAVYICVDVISRKVFSVSIRGDVELSEYVLAVTSGWAFSYALFKKAHVRIDVVYNKLSVKQRAFFDVVSLGALVIFMLPTVYYSYHVFRTSVIRGSVANTPLHTPLWIPQGGWFVGLAFFLVLVVTMLIAVIIKTSKGDVISAFRIAGSASAMEETDVGPGLKEG